MSPPPPPLIAEPAQEAPAGARRAISERVVEEILSLIRAGELTKGQKLPAERTLATEFAVSRPTVREALRALSILGVVEIRHGGGVYVSPLDPSDLLNPLDFFMSLDNDNVAEMFDARILFEPLVAGLAVDALTDDRLDDLSDLVAAQLAAPDDAELFYDTDAQFHKIITAAAGNMFISRIGTLFQFLGEGRRRDFLKRAKIRRQSIADHEVILAALRGRDHAAAVEAMRRHMVNVREGWRDVTGV